MRTNKYDRKEKKLRQWDRLHNKVIKSRPTPAEVDASFERIMKELGLKSVELYTLDRILGISKCGRHKHGKNRYIGQRKETLLAREKSERRAEQNGIRAQYTDEQLEQQDAEEQRIIMDIYDSCYDPISTKGNSNE